MTYSVQNTDGTQTINVAASQVNSSFSVALVGRNVSGYGQYFVQNSIRHLENFASEGTPPTPDIKLEGQIWYDKQGNVMKVWDGTGWHQMSTTVSATAPVINGNQPAGTAYVDTTDDKLKIHNGTAWADASYAGKVSNDYAGDTVLGSPAKYGTRVRSMEIPSDTGVYKAVLALMYVSDGTDNGFTDGESIMAIFSDHTAFDVHTTTPARVEGLGTVAIYAELSDATHGIGTTIKPGMNLRSKYSTTAIALANSALQADSANSITNSALQNIVADNIIHDTKSYEPTTAGLQLGSAAAGKEIFSELHVNTIYIGDATSSSAQYIKKAKVGGSSNVVLDIGESDAPVDNIYVSNITLAAGGGITGLNVESFGSSAEPIDQAFITNVAVGTFHVTSAGLYGNIVDAGGTVVFNPASGSAVQESTTQTLSNKTFGSDILVTDTSINIGSSGTPASSVFASTFTGVNTVLTGTANAVTFNGNVSGATGTFTGNVDATNFNGDVSGATGTFTGNVDATYFNGVATSAQFADLAEIYLSEADWAPGTVVKIGGEYEVTITTEHADIDVFGVVSTNPAYLMNSEADGVPVALAGRVPVRVIGPVAKGQRLTSSGVAGFACAADDETPLQAIIGRSLESIDSTDETTIEAVIGVK
jgi:hypothetical protein|tara:strand:+ start:4233 stop:6173 length:1941 start_codon:yes stop_codon:yes gene_type:complete